MERAVPRRRQLLVLIVLCGCAPLEGMSAVELSDGCASCHPLQSEEHAGSKHAQADASPVFQALRERADTELCDACHRKMTCIDCHAAVGNEAVMNGLMIWDPDGPVRGPTGIAPGAPHATARSTYLESSDLCGTCHEVRGPAGFTETPFTHWLTSPAAARNLTCSDCHTTHRREVRYGDAVRLSHDGKSIAIDHSNGGHHFPDGASFLREVALVGRHDGVEILRVPFGAELISNGVPVVLPTDAAETVLRGVEAGSVRRVPLETWSGTFCLEVERFRSDLLRALGVEVERPVEAFGCISL